MDHEFAIEITLPLTKEEAYRLYQNQRKVFRKIDPFGGEAISAVVGCTVCGRGMNLCVVNPACSGSEIKDSDGPMFKPSELDPELREGAHNA